MSTDTDEVQSISVNNNAGNLEVTPGRGPQAVETPAMPSFDWADDPSLTITARHRAMQDELEFESYRRKIVHDKTLLTKDIVMAEADIRKSRQEEEEQAYATGVMQRLSANGLNKRSDWIAEIHKSAGNKVLLKTFEELDRSNAFSDSAQRLERKEQLEDEKVQADLSSETLEQRTKRLEITKNLENHRNLYESTVTEAAMALAEDVTISEQEAKIAEAHLNSYAAIEKRKISEQSDYFRKKIDSETAMMEAEIAKGKDAEVARQELQERKLATAYTMVQMFRKSGVNVSDEISDDDLAQNLNTVGFTPDDIPALRYGLANLGSNAEDQKTYQSAVKKLKSEDPAVQRLGKAQLASLIETWRINQMSAANEMDGALARAREANLKRSTAKAKIDFEQAQARHKEMTAVISYQDETGKYVNRPFADLPVTDRRLVAEAWRARGGQAVSDGEGGYIFKDSNGDEIEPEGAMAGLEGALRREMDAAAKAYSDKAGTQVDGNDVPDRRQPPGTGGGNTGGGTGGGGGSSILPPPRR